MRIAIANQAKRQGDGYYFMRSGDGAVVEYLVYHQNRMAAIIKSTLGYLLADARHTALIPRHDFDVAKRAVVLFVEAIKARHEYFDMEIPEDEQPTQTEANPEA